MSNGDFHVNFNFFCENKNYLFYEFYEKPHYSKIAHGFVFAPKPFLLTFKFAISLYLMYKTGHGSKNLLPVEAGCVGPSK